VTYLAYVPFVSVFQPTNQQVTAPTGYELPSALAAALAFDLLTIVGLFLLGRQLRRGREGQMLGLALAYGWVSFPYTMFPLMTSTNDALISMLLVGALLAITSPRGRGVFVALASAAKFAPLTLAPLFATGRGERPRKLSWTWFGLAFVVVVAALVLPFIPAKGGFGTFWSQTLGFQLSRQSPFSIWGQNPSLDGLLTVTKIGVVALAVAVAFVPRRRTAVQVAALGAAVVIATQLTAIHWFYLYIDWFMPFALVALFCEYATGRGREGRPEPATVEIGPKPLASRRERELVGVA
jgi:hypothetical protein